MAACRDARVGAMRARPFALAALVIAQSVLVAATDVEGHTRSRSFSSWRVAGTAVTVLFTVRAFEATRLPRGPGESRPLVEVLAVHVGEHLGVRHEGEPCPPLAAPRPLAAREGYLRLERSFECARSARDGGSYTLENDAFFDVAPSHVHIARVVIDDARPLERVLTDDDRTPTVAAPADGAGVAAASTAAATAGTYVVLGVEHILAGIDHLAFLLGLLLLCRRVREIVWMVTGFTLGHSLTLALAVVGAIEPDQALVEALIGFTIALVAFENVAVATGRAHTFALIGASVLLVLLGVKLLAGLGPSAVALLGLALFTGCYLPLAISREESARLRPLLTVLFGLVHGFGFAGVLAEVGLPRDRTLAALCGFNVGVELGQLAVVALLAGAGVALSVVARGRGGVDGIVDPASAALCGLGLFWFFARAYT